MIRRKQGLIITFLLITIIQVILYLSNSQKTTFRYFIWTIQEIKIGKLIAYSFTSGLIVSIILNKISEHHYVNNLTNDDEYYEDAEGIKIDKNEEITPDIPPQRDIRETQPTISVNYRVIKNNKNNFSEYYDNLPCKKETQDDWNKNNDW